jgi:transposase InsO family protein
VEEANLGCGSEDRAGAEVHRSFPSTGSRCRCLSPPYAVAARRLPLRPSGHDPGADPLFTASLPATARHLTAARGRWRPPRLNKFKTYPIGYFHIDIAGVRTEQGKLYPFVAIDRTSKFAFVEVHERATQRVAADFLNAVLTDNGVHFTTPGNRCSAAAEIRLALERGEIFRAHAFEFACAKADIDHRLTKTKHPWNNDQVERMNRTLKEATVKRFYYETHQHFPQHLADFVNAYNFARRLKTIRGLTPYEYICSIWTKEPQRFKLNPTHLTSGPNS